MRLKEIAKIESGFQFRKRIEHNPDGDVRVFQIKDVQSNLSMDTRSLTSCVIGKKKSQKYLITKGDVLFISKGNKNQAGVLTENINNVVASSQFLVIRPDKKRIFPLYLAWFINNAYRKGYFKQVGEGSYIPFISKKTLGSMEISVPPINVQKKIVGLYKLQIRETNLLSQLNQLRQKLINNIIQQRLTKFNKE